MENKDFLIKRLQLSDCLLNDDNNVIEIAKEINNLQLDEDQQQMINDDIKSYIENVKDYNIIKLIVQEIKFVNSNYILSLLDLKQIEMKETDKTITMLKDKLLKDDIIFDTEFEKYMYYSLIVNITIMIKNEELIKLAIDKVQSLC